MADTTKDLGRLVKSLREQLGLSQEKFAAKLGVTFSSVNRWENGHRKPSPLAMKQIEILVIELGAKGKALHEEYFAD
ncbi:DNA-binding transcriptional regulator YiaG [Rhodopirellula rubra]|uniref:DNA-binding transcriptional regulator YiaG n=1 Tax=Aporhodopirellula rubra TaxID=980271 RepID=A0A7W5DXR3_9BACT|nr:helix-turn-helix transcriptional regulator [Aporhodopirellula rubra]MBB3205517.1 DNA-binding transcriptional regulator YiaG [Aporhodopirellula rubra]